MSKIQLSKADFLTKAAAFYDTLHENLDDEKQDFYEYESKFDALHTDFGKTVLEGFMGELPANPRKKKSSNQIRNNHNSGAAHLQ
jgi:hypothetical protein